jgi:hypothetical protein
MHMNTVTFTNPKSGSKIELEAGCILDGHHGQYLAKNTMKLVDGLLDTDFADQAARTAPDDFDVEIADEAIEAMNDHLENGFFEFIDGELFLTYIRPIPKATLDSSLLLQRDGDGNLSKAQRVVIEHYPNQHTEDYVSAEERHFILVEVPNWDDILSDGEQAVEATTKFRALVALVGDYMLEISDDNVEGVLQAIAENMEAIASDAGPGYLSENLHSYDRHLRAHDIEN